MHVSRLSSLPPPPPPSPPAALAASSEGLTSFFVSNSQVGVKDVPLEPPYNNNLYNNNLRSVSPSLSNTYQVHACILLLLTCFASLSNPYQSVSNPYQYPSPRSQVGACVCMCMCMCICVWVQACARECGARARAWL